MKSKRTISVLLLLVMCFSLFASISVSAANVTYYPKYTGSSGSIVDGLKAVGADSSYSNRSKIAQLNGITDYSGTAAQNTKMLNLLKQGKLIKSKTAATPVAPSGKAQKLVSVALNEVGYHGTRKNGTGTGDYTKYGKWMNQNGVYWCAEFVSWCVNRAGISTSVVPKTASTLTMARNSNAYVKWSSSALNNLKPGDVIFFSHTKKSLTTSSGSKSVYHVGIVVGVNVSKGTITIVEGNTSSDYVKKNTYTVTPSTGWFSSGSWFCGYISIK